MRLITGPRPTPGWVIIDPKTISALPRNEPHEAPVVNRVEAEKETRRLAELMQRRDGGLRWPFATRELFRALRVIKNTKPLRIDRPPVGRRDPNCEVCGEKSAELGHGIPHRVGVYEWRIDPRWLQLHGTVPVCKDHNKAVDWDEDLVAKTIHALRKDVEEAGKQRASGL